MKVTKRYLRKLIIEGWHDDKHETLADKKYAEPGEPEWTEEELANAIRDYSKELTGRRDKYGDFEDLQALTWIELSDHYEAMFDSPEAVELRKQREREDKKFADSEVGHDEELHSLEKSPLRQGMGHRQESVNRLIKIIKEESKSVLRESYMKQRFTELSDIVLQIIDETPGLDGNALARTVIEVFNHEYRFGKQPHAEKEEVFTVLDVMQEDGEVFFDTQEDAWYAANSPEAIAAMDTQDQFSSREANPHDGGMYGEGENY